MRRALGPTTLTLVLGAILVVLAACGGRERPLGSIAFAAGGSIYTLELPAGTPQRVVEGDRDDEPRWASAPALSPDGALLAFSRDGDLWIVEATGGDARRIVDRNTTPRPTGASQWQLGVQTAAWSPDGELLAYVVARIGGSGLAELWFTDPAGYEPQQIDADRVGLPVEAAWSVEGEPVFASVATSPNGTGTDAVTSPDGRWVAYVIAEQILIVTAEGRINRRVDLRQQWT